MTDPWDLSSEDKMPFLALFARGVIEWNKAEQAMYSLLGKSQGFSGPPHFAQWVVVFELGTRSLVFALKTLAHDFYEGEKAEHIAHAAEHYSRLSLYRNYYVHALQGVISHAEGRVYGSLGGMTAKGKLVSVSDELTIDKLERFIDEAASLSSFAGRLADVIAAGRMDIEGESLPDKPPLPVALQKNQETMRAIRLRN